MVFISQDRLSFAFGQLQPEDGGEFERFVNAFLMKEIPGLRPVAGMHDGARDAFIYRVDSAEASFVQSSVTTDWRRKVRRTIATLQKNGNAVRELIYCSPLAILSEADDLRAELRSLGISLDIRDRNYFLSGANSTPKQSELCEQFARKYVNPVLARDQLAEPSGILLTEREERLALVYLGLQLKDKSSEMALTKFSFDALVKYALRDSSPQELQTREQILASVLRAVPSHDTACVKTLVASSLERLVKRRVVNHHRKEDGYTLAFDFRELTSDAIIVLAAEKAQLLDELTTRVRRVAADEAIDYDFEPRGIADDVMSILTLYFGRQGRQTAKAFVSGEEYRKPFADTYALCDFAARRYGTQLHSLKNLGDERFLDIVPLAIDDVLTTPTAVSRSYLQRLADASLLMFFLRENPDIQKTIGKVFQTGVLLIDASYVVPCLAETVLREPQRRFTSLLDAAKAFGMALCIGDEGLNELTTHLRKVRSEAEVAEKYAPELALAESVLTRAYLSARQSGSVEDIDSFLYRFIGDLDAKQDLIDTLDTLFGIEYRPFTEELQCLDQDLVARVTELWRKLRRRRSGIAEEAFDVLVEHDVMAYLLVQSLRSGERTQSKYGYTTWWLTLDRTGFRVREAARKSGISFASPVGSCMSPDFLLRYMSIRPHPASEDTYISGVLPLSIELAGVGLVPSELREAAREVLKSVENEPQYVQRRRLRDLLNKARSEEGELLGSAIEETERLIDESTDRDGHD